MVCTCLMHKCVQNGPCDSGPDAVQEDALDDGFRWAP